MKLVEYLESKMESVQHIPHIEELILSNDTNKAIDILEQLVESKLTPTIKFDGMPAVIFGINPENGKFAIGSKRIYTRPAHSEKEINEIYSDIDELRVIFLDLFKYLKPYVKSGMYMGDLMWRKDKPLRVNGDNIVFQPNTIVYQVPKDSKLGKEIINKPYGMVLHTKLTGQTLKTMSKSSDIDIEKFKSIPEVWVGDAKIDTYAGNDKKFDFSDIAKDINDIKKYYAHASISDIIPLTRLQPIFNKLNQTQFDKTTSVDKKLEILIDIIKEVYNKNYKTPNKLNEVLEKINSNPKLFKDFIELNDRIIDIKNKIMSRLNSVAVFKTSLDPNGVFDSNVGEGFVIPVGNGMVKLVDRKEFSRINAIKNEGLMRKKQ